MHFAGSVRNGYDRFAACRIASARTTTYTASSAWATPRKEEVADSGGNKPCEGAEHARTNADRRYRMSQAAAEDPIPGERRIGMVHYNC